MANTVLVFLLPVVVSRVSLACLSQLELKKSKGRELDSALCVTT